MPEDNQLDCVGLYCPMPIVQTARRIKEMNPGQILEVIADDPGIREDMPNWCKMTGNSCLDIQEKDGIYHVFIKKT